MKPDSISLFPISPFTQLLTTGEEKKLHFLGGDVEPLVRPRQRVVWQWQMRPSLVDGGSSR